MAVIVDFLVPGATPEQMYAVEALTQARGEAAGRPPFDGCMFIAATAVDSGFDSSRPGGPRRSSGPFSKTCLVPTWQGSA